MYIYIHKIYILRFSLICTHLPHLKFTTPDLSMLQVHVRPLIPGEDDEVASENVAVAIPRISISAPALKIPAVEDPKDPKDSEGPSVPSTRKPGDLLKEQLGHAQNGMTFADGVRIEAAQKVLLVTFFSR